MKTNQDLVEELIQLGYLKTPRIIEAFLKIKREDFVLDDFKKIAYFNEVLPIGYNQTISQPLVVAFMLEKLQPEKGDKILDIGSGSGWTTALLSYIVGQNGKVIGLEIIPELVQFGISNVSKYNFIKKGVAKIIYYDGSAGYNKEAPYDKILCSAQAESLPSKWINQLNPEGRIVTPINNSIWVVEKKKEGKIATKEYPGFVFVPLVNKNEKEK